VAESLPQSGSEFVLAKTLLDSAQSARAMRFNGSMRYTTTSISWLDAHGRRKRQTVHSQIGSKLSHLLRTLGEHLDKRDLTALNIVWSANGPSVDCLGGYTERQDLSIERLRELGLRMKFWRSPGKPLYAWPTPQQPRINPLNHSSVLLVGLTHIP
jgi:hypothetical protein